MDLPVHLGLVELVVPAFRAVGEAVILVVVVVCGLAAQVVLHPWAT